MGRDIPVSISARAESIIVGVVFNMPYSREYTEKDYRSADGIIRRYDDSWMKEIDSIKKEQPFIYREVEFYNIDTLEKFLRTHLKDHLAKRLEDEKEILLYLDEIMNEESSYELPSYQTRSGNAENIYFKRVDEVDEETGEIKTIIRF